MRDFSETAVQTRILTVGYEKSELASYIDRLVEAKVEVLVDVRERPISRKRGFSKRALSEAVTSAGIRYLHVQELGDPKPGRDAARAGQHAEFMAIFTAHMKTDAAQGALAELAESISGLKICLTCFERDHTSCHRSVVATQLAELTGATVQHLKV